MPVTFGRNTMVKLLGGALYAREAGTPVAAMRSQLDGIQRRALDLSVPFSAFREILYEQEVRVFAAQGLPVAWPELSPGYRAWKSAHFPGKTIMRRTDRLYESLTGGADGIYEVTPRTIRWGTAVPYWAYTQDNRPTIVILPETMLTLNEMCVAFIMDEPYRSLGG